MRRVLPLLLLLAGCAGVPFRTATTPASLEASALVGTWHVVASNFPMWLDGTKTKPTFTYGVLPGGTLSDVVRYEENGAVGYVEGTDTQDGTHFTWRGTGALIFFTSEWDVAELDPNGEWAVIVFGRTLATPEGVDVITRAAVPPAEVFEAALRAIAADPALKLKADGLKKLF